MSCATPTMLALVKTMLPMTAPAYSASDKLRFYAILGGMPAYLELFDDSPSIADNIRDNMLEESSFLYREARFLLMEELREPRRYYSIVRAIASGRAKSNEIAQDVGISTAAVGAYIEVLRDPSYFLQVLPLAGAAVGAYIEVLRDLRLIEREVPVSRGKAR